MRANVIIAAVFVGIIIFAIAVPVFSLEDEWKTGRLTSIGDGFIKVNSVRYRVSPNVVITGEKGDDLGSDLKNLHAVDEIMFRVANETIVEIKVLKLTS
ncbi:MAG: hypothetical protein HZC11_05155 [Nitrospirae bacterium]|nr:hypothetical protein [Nitrospirota bacterium]